MSGIGVNGGISRCFPLMQDLQRCLKTSDDIFKDCLVFKDEYMECLHHRVEFERYQELKKQEKINKELDKKG